MSRSGLAHLVAFAAVAVSFSIRAAAAARCYALAAEIRCGTWRSATGIGSSDVLLIAVNTVARRHAAAHFHLVPEL
jgi:hypothetical protein